MYPCGIEYPVGALMDDETMQLLKVFREQLGEPAIVGFVGFCKKV